MIINKKNLCFSLLFFVCLSFSPALAADPTKPISGTASWFGHWHHGKTTASGEPFDMFAMTAAHKKIPFGTVLQITNTENGRQVMVKVNDRGPFVKKRILDLSYGAALKLGMSKSGIAPIMMEPVSTSGGEPLDKSQAFFVSLTPVEKGKSKNVSQSLVSKELGRLFKVGLYDEALHLNISNKGLVLGPFEHFADAHQSLMKVSTTYPGASITLEKREDAVPVRSEVAQLR